MITLDEDDIKVSCLNISSNQLPGELLLDLLVRFKVWPEYFDQGDMREHMFTVGDVKEGLGMYDITRWDSYIDEIEKLMEENCCSYFRIISVK